MACICSGKTINGKNSMATKLFAYSVLYDIDQTAKFRTTMKKEQKEEIGDDETQENSCAHKSKRRQVKEKAAKEGQDKA